MPTVFRCLHNDAELRPLHSPLTSFLFKSCDNSYWHCCWKQLNSKRWIVVGKQCPCKIRRAWHVIFSEIKSVISRRLVFLSHLEVSSHCLLRLLTLSFYLASTQLRDMKCSIDNKCPRAASHLKTKAKKNALMEDRFAQIETENRLLLEKMSHIMRVSSFHVATAVCKALP